MILEYSIENNVAQSKPSSRFFSSFSFLCSTFCSPKLQPIADLEDGKGDNRDEPHYEEMNPKAEVVVDKGHSGIHRHHVGIGSEWEEDSRKNGEYFHRLIELV